MVVLIGAVLLIGVLCGTPGQTEDDTASSAFLHARVIELYSQGKYSEAIPIAEKVVKSAKNEFGENHVNYAACLNNLALLYKSMGQYEKAEPLYRQVMGIFRKALGEDHPDYATSLNNLAGHYHSMGQYEKAEPLYKQAMGIRKKALGEDHPDYAISLNNLALLYYSMGQYEKAEPLYKQAMGIRKKALGEDHPDYAASLNNLASLYDSMGQYEKAEPLYKQAIVICKEALGEDHPDYAGSLNNLAGLYRSMGQYEKAEPLLKQAIGIFKKVLGEDHPDYATSLNNLAGHYHSIGQYEKAEPLYKQAMWIRKKALGEDHPDYATNLINLAALYATMGQFDLSLDYQNKGMLAEQRKIKTVFPSLTENERQAYLDTVNYSLDCLVSQSAQNGANSAFRVVALDWVLKRKGIILSSLLEDRERLRLARNAGTTDILEKLGGSQSRLAKLVYAGPGKEGAEAFNSECVSLRLEIESYQKSLAAVSAAYAGNLASTDADTASVSAALTKGSALVEMINTVFDFKAKGKEPNYKENRIVCFVLFPGDKTPVMIDLGEAGNIEEAVRKFRKVVVDKSGEMECGKEVYDLVWSKIEPYLKGVDYVFISPDSDLNLLSFASLPTSDGSYLCEKYVINTIASGRDLLRKPIDAGVKSEFVAFADPEFGTNVQTKNVMAALPSREVFRSAFIDRGMFGSVKLSSLPGTREEAESAEAMFKAKDISTKAFFGADATETAVKSLSKPGYLLLATHGFFLNDPSWMRERKETSGIGGEIGTTKVSLALENPMHRSGLVFAGAQRAIKGESIPEGADDGLLTAEEVVTMDLEGTKLANLSACETGLGEVKRGEGVMGLRRAFVMAGCNALVMSLWNVPDKSTQELMNSFYSQYLENGNPVRSMAKAQRDMLKTRRAEGKPTNPYYWGAFAVTSVVGK